MRAERHDRAFALLLRLYPRAFRRRFGADMRAAFGDRLAEVAVLGGSAVARLWARTVADVGRCALAAWLPGRSLPIPSARRGGGAQESHLMERVVQDLRFAARLLRKSPAFTLSAVVTLALGIGANAAIFSLVDALLFKPPPGVAEPERLVALYTSERDALGVSSYLDYLDISERMGSLAALAAYKPREVDLSSGDVPERLDGMLVTGSYFGTLGVRPAVGRLIGPDDDREPDGHAVAVLSHRLWRTRYAGDTDVVGRSILVNGREYTILGVAPEGFRGTWLASGPDIYVPMMMQAHLMPTSGPLLDRRGWSGVLLIGRLGPDATLARARSELDDVGAWLRVTYPRESGERHYSVAPFEQATLMPSVRGSVVQFGGLLSAVVGLVLLVACVNVANLLLARSANRGREIAIRQALGASRGRVVGQLVCESLLLALIGGGAGLLVARLMTASIGRIPLPLVVEFGVDGRVVAFTAFVALLTGLAFGLAPALRAASDDVKGRLRDSSENRRRGLPLGRLLLVVQVAVSMVLLTGAVLFGRTLTNLQSSELGFDPEGVAVLGVDPALQGYSDEEAATMYAAVLDEAAALPGVLVASYVDSLPGPQNDDFSSFRIVGYSPEEGSPGAFINFVGPRYFEALRLPLVTGRTFAATDDAGGRPVVVVNEAAAAYLEALTGRPATETLLQAGPPEAPAIEVIGVVRDSSTGKLGSAPRRTVYLPHAQHVRGAASRVTFLLRVTGDPAAYVEQLRDLVRRRDASLPVFDDGTLRDHLRRTLGQERLSAAAMGAAAALALSLALVGLYGVLAYSVSRRRAELGLRMALGARRGDVLAMVLGQGLGLVAVGLTIGLAMALAAGRFLGSLLYGVSAADPLMLVGLVTAMLVMAVIAAWLPARRAVHTDPVGALRSE